MFLIPEDQRQEGFPNHQDRQQLDFVIILVTLCLFLKIPKFLNTATTLKAAPFPSTSPAPKLTEFARRRKIDKFSLERAESEGNAPANSLGFKKEMQRA